jgi:cytochrome c oxidase cbb3-type subunit 3/ubiquinol-cytochrome c reductase cytochrome c subunit
MKSLPLLPLLLACSLTLPSTGCKDAPGKPKPGADAESQRPDQVLDFASLYQQNCVACHGQNGQNGASISLSNPVYIAVAGESNIQRIAAAGVPGTLMPGFGKAAGGMLTDQQIAVIAHGIVQTWGHPLSLNGQTLPAYASSTTGDPAQGQKTFTTFCASCHGPDGAGTKGSPGSIVDPAYLALVNDQYLRSTIISGRPESHMPDWRSYPSGSGSQPHILTDQEITDTVAWLATHRIATPGQPYQQHQ